MDYAATLIKYCLADKRRQGELFREVAALGHATHSRDDGLFYVIQDFEEKGPKKRFVEYWEQEARTPTDVGPTPLISLINMASHDNPEEFMKIRVGLLTHLAEGKDLVASRKDVALLAAMAKVQLAGRIVYSSGGGKPGWLLHGAPGCPCGWTKMPKNGRVLACELARVIADCVNMFTHGEPETSPSDVRTRAAKLEAAVRSKKMATAILADMEADFEVADFEAALKERRPRRSRTRFCSSTCGKG